jgi:vacuolar protein sorting-associated protein 35
LLRYVGVSPIYPISFYISIPSRIYTPFEILQYTPSFLERLYTQITVVAAWMKQNAAPKKEIMMDMLDMCKGIQHSVRGLFLRHYLAGVTRDRLPEGKEEDR